MKVIEKYLLKSFWAPFIWCIIAFLFLYIIIDVFENLDEILRSAPHYYTLIKYYASSIPKIFVRITPLAILLSLIYTLSKLNKRNEITAMRASGVRLLSIFKPFIIVGILVSVLILLVNLNIVPITNKVAKNIETNKLEKKRKEEKKIVKNVTLYGYNNRIIFAKKFNSKKNTLSNVIILKQYKDKLVERVTAQKAVWEKEGDWKLFESMTYYMKPNGAIVGNPSFNSETTINLQEKPKSFIYNYTKAEFMKYDELKEHIEKFKGGSNKVIRRLLIELYKKISIPFVNIIMVLIAIPFALQINYTGTFISVGICVGVGFCYYAINAISVALGNAGILPPFIAVWLANIIFIAVGIVLLIVLKD